MNIKFGNFQNSSEIEEKTKNQILKIKGFYNYNYSYLKELAILLKLNLKLGVLKLKFK